MKIIHTTSDFDSYYQKLKEKSEKTHKSRMTCIIISCVISIVLNFILSLLIPFFLPLILLSLLSSTFFCFFLPRILFRIFPSCQYTSYPTPKAFLHEIKAIGTNLSFSLKKKKKGKKYEVGVRFENKEGKEEERKIEMKGKKLKGIKEKVIDFDTGVVWEPEN